MISVHTKLISLLGNPLAQTFAPQMFNETFEALDMDYFYFPIEVEGADLGTIVNAIRCMNYVGFNVTKPNKSEILPLLDDVDELAQTIGSVNVVTISDGVLKGYNTDGIGFVQALLDRTGMELGQNTFLVFGAGGASKAICSTLAYQGAREIYIVDKFDEASSALVEGVNSKIRKCAHYVPFTDAPIESLIGQANVLVNATGIGMYPKVENTPIDKRLLREELFVVDITYNPIKTRLLLDAEEKGCRTMNGVEMAINQGTRGFSLMTGLPEPVEIMREVMHRIVAPR
jgi:shikimate dehydrogenase